MLRDRQPDFAVPGLRTVLYVSITILALWALGVAVLLLFASFLLATFLVVTGQWTARRLSVPYGAGLTIVVAVLAVAVFGASVAVEPTVAVQLETVAKDLPPAIESLITGFSKTAVGHVVALFGFGAAGNPNLLEPLLNSVGSVAVAIGSIIFVAFAGIYMAVAPRLYIEGLLRLLPPARRYRARQIVGAIGTTIKMFLFGRLVSMSVIAGCSIIGLWALGVPAPVALGLISGVMSFVPYIGSAASAVPPALLAYLQHPIFALYVVALYIGIHLLEEYVLAPLVQQRATHLPPAITLAAQLVFGILWGVLGIAVATPLAAGLLTFVRMAYVEDVLEASNEAAEKTKA